ncbi:MAG: hypothetical protein A2563_03930 [Candidatus Magasanikbacteria bacterium RIFOXYD1_FULL_40_23]|uniref:Uncharacterized protein n=1 Tax=Candidatus Magasanikbacteria bacterium RIFOXYD1_FULL_40_23 TaxID=1798705 RepID=A0A1F6P9S6_9BACT|nr:MAG: hypothetical protein A2563_03930 [Candidatus Magasanikbacteria bacterium RIFOXYD1_FULL_40_23]
MVKSFLNFFFHYSGAVFRIKRHILEADKWYKSVFFSLILFFVEFIFVVISLPFYFLISPKNLHERGFIFPSSKDDSMAFKHFVARRKISAITLISVSAVWAFKVFLLGAISYIFFGAAQIFADTHTWVFSNPSSYTYNSSLVEVAGGEARLKDIGGTTIVTTTNPGFNSNATGWTYADWNQSGGEVNVAGTRITTGGNPGGWVRINFPIGNGDELGGYYRQPFVISLSNPSTTVSFDWQVLAHDSTPAPVTFKMMVFVDRASSVPVIGQEVWSSGEITSTSTWQSISNLDVSSKVTSTGTYYLKVAVWLETPGSNTGPFTIGYDNILLTSASTSHVFSSSLPSIAPNTSLSDTKIVSWNSFSETAIKNGGQIYYQLSDDDGVSWKYWNGSSWAAAATTTNSNTSSVINAHISSFTTSTNQIKWKGFLSSDGTQQVSLSAINIDYTSNNRPAVPSISASQQTSDGLVNVNYILQDAESDLSSLSAYEYSFDLENWFVMTAAVSDPEHSGINNLLSSPVGVAHTFVWNALADLGSTYNSSVYVRLRANDGIADGPYATSTIFAVDYVVPTVSNLSAAQDLGSASVRFVYDLFDNTSSDLFVELLISDDGGSTWNVASSSVSGDVGAGLSSGTNKTITWQAVADFVNQEQDDMQVRIRARDKFSNQGNFVTSINFLVDTQVPTVNTTTNLLAQPNAGDSSVLVGGSFHESNPGTSSFFVAINGGDYGAVTYGEGYTASPSPQLVSMGAPLTGADYISKVSLSLEDKYGHTGQNENTSPESSYKYVKPYTPPAPAISNPQSSTLDLVISKHADEIDGLEYAIFEGSQSKYIQDDGTLGDSPVWKSLGTGVGQWGEGGEAGKVIIQNLSQPISAYVFQIKSRNISDSFHAASSESGLSGGASLSYISPSINISISSLAQTADGTKYVPISYSGADAQSNLNSLVVYEYSTDNTTWQTMTEKTGVGSDGKNNLVFAPAGTEHMFAWDVGADLSGVEFSTVRVRLQSYDGVGNSNLSVSSVFEIDTAGPVISGIQAAQSVGSSTVNVSYDLSDGAGINNVVEFLISSNAGVDYLVPTTTVVGDVGAGISSGVNKNIVWNAGVDFANQTSAAMRVKIMATDRYGNVGSFTESSNFNLDTSKPVLVVTGAAQVVGTDLMAVSYNLSDVSSTITLWISADGGSTWFIPTSSVSGDIGFVSSAGDKTLVWNMATDFIDQETNSAVVRIMATDYFGNISDYASSSIFSLDTKAPIISTVSAAQIAGTSNVSINYDFSDLSSLSNVYIEISSDGGLSWSVATSTLAGDVGVGVSTGSGKQVSWNAGVDLPNREVQNARVRIMATDNQGNSSAKFISNDFVVNTIISSAAETPAVSGGGVAIPITTVPETEDTVAPGAPIVFSPDDNSNISETALVLIGGTEPLAVVELILNEEETFNAYADNNGTWRFVLPSAVILKEGANVFQINAKDEAGNVSASLFFRLNKAVLTAAGIVPIFTTSPIVTAPIITTPAPVIIPTRPVAPTPATAPVIAEVNRAVEVLSIPAPEVDLVVSPVQENLSTNDIIRFSGIALPNQELIVYVHSEQALIYRAKANNQGVWSVDHSQKSFELAPGVHTVYAVGLNNGYNIKSRPGLVKTFTVSKNYWVAAFNYLNLQTTIIATAVLIFAMGWLYILRKREQGYFTKNL